MGLAHGGIVGMRLGANFASVQGFEPVDAVVLWDPCPTGRSFLREQRLLGLLAGADAAEENVDPLDLPGFKVSPEMANEISGLDLWQANSGLPGRDGLPTRCCCSHDRNVSLVASLPSALIYLMWSTGR
jgi:hypothetical protein